MTLHLAQSYVSYITSLTGVGGISRPGMKQILKTTEEEFTCKRIDTNKDIYTGTTYIDTIDDTTYQLDGAAYLQSMSMNTTDANTHI